MSYTIFEKFGDEYSERRMVEAQITDKEKSLAGYHKDHYMVKILIAQIAQLKEKIEVMQHDYSTAAFNNTLNEQIQLERKSLAGYGEGHYMIKVIQGRIIKLQERIQKKTRN